MLQEYDVVTLVRAVEGVPVVVGTQGVILIVYDSVPVAYEVELIDAEGNSLGAFTLQKNDIDLTKIS